MKKPKPPCGNNCQNRNESCHSTCKEYLGFKKALEEFKDSCIGLDEYGAYMNSNMVIQRMKKQYELKRRKR